MLWRWLAEALEFGGNTLKKPALGDPALATAQKERAALGAAPDPVQCRKTCDELQAKGELAVPVAECVQKLCAD